MENNFGIFLSKRAEMQPEREALYDATRGLRFTYRELEDRANRIAHSLYSRGIRPGDRVALLLLNSVEFAETFFAVARIGAIVVPLNWRLVADELEFILKDGGAKMLVFGDEFLDKVADLHSRGPKTDIETWVHVSDDASPPDFAEEYANLLTESSERATVPGATDDDELFIMYTSGTTGLPKGAVHTHESTIWSSFTGAATLNLYDEDRYLNVLPLFHVGALHPLIMCVHIGTPCILLREFDPIRCWQIIQEEKITALLAVPAMLNGMLSVLSGNNFDHSTLRWIMSGAAPVPVTLIEAYNELGIKIRQVYGLTECCGPACLISNEDAIRKAGSTGKAFFHTTVRVVDADMKEVPAETPGEVIVRGKHIMQGYWQRPEANAQTLVDGWLKTGDVAVRDEEGFIYIKDRTKDMIISGGENIYPAELENVLLGHELISDAAVIGQPSTKWGESPFAVIVRRDDSLAFGDVVAYCRDKMAGYKVPKGVAFVDEIPRNPSGKILKRVLREEFPGPACD